MNTDFIDFINQQIHRTLQHFQEPSAASPHYTKPTFYMQDGIIHYQLQEPVKLFIQGKEGSLGYYIGTGYVPPFKHYEAFSSYFFNQPEHGEIHRHEFYECTYVLEGTYGYGIGDQIITLSQGDCILMDTNCIHWNRYGKTDMKVLYLAFQKELLEHILSLASPAYLQEQLHFNTAYYNRLVKKRFGITLVQYIQKKRLAKAKQLLAETNLPVGKIIEKIGYQNRYHFYTLFAREPGMTPIEYRTQEFHILLSQQKPSLF